MTSSRPRPSPRRRSRWPVPAALAVATAALLGTGASPFGRVTEPEPAPTATAVTLQPVQVREPGAGRAPADEASGAGGRPEGSPAGDPDILDESSPAVARLDPELLDALRRAAGDAAEDGVGFTVNSGWRSPQHQAQLLREATSKYGSAEEAARWVATPQTSPHVSGDAVDVGGPRALTWLSDHGAAYGLCQIYRNEPWHYELRPEAVDEGCPRMYADPTEDPRMQ